MTTPMVPGAIPAKIVTVNGKQFQMYPLYPLLAARVNGQLSAIFGPLLMGQIPEVSKLLLGLPDAQQEAMVSALVSTTLYLPSGENAGALELKDPAGMTAAFACDLEGLYSLLFEIMEYNGFPFFVKLKEAGARFLKLIEGLQKQAMDAVDGSETKETAGSESQMSEEAKLALNSKRSGPYPTTLETSTLFGG